VGRRAAGPPGVPRAVLPEIRSCSEVYGTTQGLGVLPDGIPVAGMAGDQQAALFGQVCFAPGEAKCTFGTGAFLLMNTGERPVHSERGLLTTVAWKVGEEVHYALEGSAFIAGAAVQWLRDGLGTIRSAPEIETLARKVDSSGGVVLVTPLAGLGAPYWDAEARGSIAGITRGTTAAHLAYATLEGIAQEVTDLLEAMDALHLDKVHIVGHSWGGKVVNHAIATFPKRFLSAVLADPAPPQGLNLLIRGLPWVAEATLRAERGPFADREAWWNAGPNLAYLQHWDTADQNIWKSSFKERPTGGYEHVLPESGFHEIMRQTLQQDITDMLERIVCPVLLLRPTLTVSFLPGEFRSMRKRVPKFREERIQGDHTFIHTNPHDTADAIWEHVRQAEGH